jgi:hypothetical protein
MGGGGIYCDRGTESLGADGRGCGFHSRSDRYPDILTFVISAIGRSQTVAVRWFRTSWIEPFCICSEAS